MGDAAILQVRKEIGWRSICQEIVVDGHSDADPVSQSQNLSSFSGILLLPFGVFLFFRGGTLIAKESDTETDDRFFVKNEVLFDLCRGEARDADVGSNGGGTCRSVVVDNLETASRRNGKFDSGQCFRLQQGDDLVVDRRDDFDAVRCLHRDSLSIGLKEVTSGTAIAERIGDRLSPRHQEFFGINGRAKAIGSICEVAPPKFRGGDMLDVAKAGFSGESEHFHRREETDKGGAIRFCPGHSSLNPRTDLRIGHLDRQHERHHEGRTWSQRRDLAKRGQDGFPRQVHADPGGSHNGGTADIKSGFGQPLPPDIARFEVDWNEPQVGRQAEAEFDQPLPLPGLRSRLVDLEHDEPRGELRSPLGKGIKTGSENDILTNARRGLLLDQIFDKASAGQDRSSERTREGTHVGTGAPVVIGRDQLQPDLIIQNVRRGIGLDMESSPESDADGGVFGCHRMSIRHDGLLHELSNCFAAWCLRCHVDILRQQRPNRLDQLGLADSLGFTAGEVLDLPDSGGEFIGTGDQSKFESLAVGVLQLFAELFCVGIDFGVDPFGSQGAADSQVVAQARGVELRDEDRRGGGLRAEQLEFFHGGQEAIEAEAGTDTGEAFLGEQSGEIVVASAGADAADAGKIAEECFVDRAGVVVEAAGDRDIEGNSFGRDACGGDRGEQFTQTTDAEQADLVPFEHRLQLIERDVGVGEFQNLAGLSYCCSDAFDHFGDDGIRANLGQLVEGAQHADRLIEQSQLAEDAVQDQPIVDADREAFEAECDQQVMNDEQRFDIGGVGVGADGVEVALDELTIASALSVFAAPDGGDVIAFEGGAHCGQVLSGKASQRDGQVEPHRDVAVALFEAEQLLVGFIAPFAGQNLGVFEGRGIDGTEPVAAKDSPCGLHQSLANEHDFREIVAEAFKRTGFN
eukprot:TRINITY_DN58_c11_g1_i5.p1 TRINITY_DN58_c11_g1~~TRINITY_DN58_c11_g1_i5.p1  ORF type:complete len:914 (+),score=171.34 TRINITY_DN58_c11_g1_i5:4186-6927(+)